MSPLPLAIRRSTKPPFGWGSGGAWWNLSTFPIFRCSTRCPRPARRPRRWAKGSPMPCAWVGSNRVMTTSGQAIFFDGATTARHDVTVELAPDVLHVRAADGTALADWRYDELEELSAPTDVLRLGRIGNPVLARLEVRDPQLAAAIDELSLPVDRTGGIERRLRAKVIAWSIAATVSLLLVAVFGVPLIATQLTPLIPYPLERKLGVAIDAQARATLDSRHAGAAFECGNAPKEAAGRAAFE